MLTLPRPGPPGAPTRRAADGSGGGSALARWLRQWFTSGGVATFLVVGGVTAFVVAQLRPDLLFAQTMDVGGDNAAHVVAVHYFIRHLLPHFQLAGWDPQWFGGFPLYVFYFPLPPLLAAFFNLFTSYAVAFKLVTVTGTIFTPLAAWAFGRLAGFVRPVPALMSAAMLAFLFNTSYTIDGGNIVSTMAGEFSFSLAIPLALLFLGVFCRSLETGKLRWLAALLFALTALSHVVPALFAAGAAALIALGRLTRHRAPRDATLAAAPRSGPARLLQWWRRLPQPLIVLVSIGLVGGLLAAFWLLPFGAYLRYSASMGYTRVTGFTANFFPGPAVIDAVIALGGCGVVIAVLRRNRVAIVLGILAGLDLLAFFYLPDGLVYNARWLPFWFLLASLLAAYALGEASRMLVRRRRSVDWAALVAPIFFGLTALGLTAAYCGVLPGYATPTGSLDEAPAWARFNYTGYQGKPGWPQFQQLIAMLDRATARHGCGRLDYEYSPNTTDAFGSTLVPMSFPLWTHGCVQSEEGVYYESSTAIYYHFLDQSELSLAPSNPVAGLPYQGLNVVDGIRHLQLTGVKYFLASSPTVEEAAAADPALVEVGASPESPGVVDRSPGSPLPPASSTFSFVLYEIRNSPIITPLTRQPVIEHLSELGWRSTSISWYQTEADWPVEITTGGPASWPVYHAGTLLPPSATARLPHTSVSDAQVTNKRVGLGRISFHVSRLGVPILVKVPYFPAWHASGAQGPWESTPDLMVVVPTSHHVVLTYGPTAIDWTARATSLIGVVGLVAIRGAVPPPAAPEEDGVDDDDGDGDDGGGGGDGAKRVGAGTGNDGDSAAAPPPLGGAVDDGPPDIGPGDNPPWGFR